jgi:hypothetical protein
LAERLGRRSGVGRAAVRDYWDRQFAAISSEVEPEGFTEEADGSITVDVHQVVHDARAPASSSPIREFATAIGSRMAWSFAWTYWKRRTSSRS